MSEVLTEIRFWAQVIGDSKRTILCQPDLESRCKGYVAARGLEGLITVQASRFVPDNQIFIVDEQAIVADAAAAMTPRFRVAPVVARPAPQTEGDRDGE